MTFVQTDNTEHKFKDLYYHLYSNSSSSRSERILADLSKLILVSISFTNGEMRSEVSLFLDGNGTANKILIPKLSLLHSDSIQAHDTFSLDDRALRYSLKILNEINLPESPSHTFGDAFQALMGPRLRGDKGQFFTPRSVVRALVDLLSPEADSRVIDPACGTGGFLSAVLDRWVGLKGKGELFGFDKDQDMALLASALSNVHDQHSKIRIKTANSLNLDEIEACGAQLGTFDYAITNPPFGAKIGIIDKGILEKFSLGHVWKHDKRTGEWFKTALVRASQDPQILFTELCVRLLNTEGKMAIILPEGVFGNKSSGYIWSYLRINGHIEALIDCPRTTFQPGTDTKTNILIFKRSIQSQANDKCWISVAYNCGHDKRGRSQKADGSPVKNDFEEIAKDWEQRENANSKWSYVKISKPFYLVPRYYDQHLTDDVRSDAKRLGAEMITIGELIQSRLVSVRKGHEVGSEAYGTGDIPFIRTSDIHNFEVSYDPTNRISEQIFQKYRKNQNLKAGDILMVVDGRYKIGRCAILHKWTTKCVVQSHIKIISPVNNANFDPYKLLYGLSLSSVQKEIRRLIFIQSTLGGLGSRINEIRIPDPQSNEDWGKEFDDFCKAIKERARHAAVLKSLGKEVDL